VGSFEHRAGIDLVEASEKRQGNAVRREVDLGGKRADLGVLNKKTGVWTFHNVGVGDPAREAESIIVILGLPMVQSNKFVFVGRDKKFVEDVRRILQGKDPTGDILNRFEIKTIADFVEA
jgi:hypothetical protein